MWIPILLWLCSLNQGNSNMLSVQTSGLPRLLQNCLACRADFEVASQHPGSWDPSGTSPRDGTSSLGWRWGQIEPDLSQFGCVIYLQIEWRCHKFEQCLQEEWMGAKNTGWYLSWPAPVHAYFMHLGLAVSAVASATRFATSMQHNAAHINKGLDRVLQVTHLFAVVAIFQLFTTGKLLATQHWIASPEMLNVKTPCPSYVLVGKCQHVVSKLLSITFWV